MTEDPEEMLEGTFEAEDEEILDYTEAEGNVRS